MTEPTDQPPQTPLPEAVEQAADAARDWVRDLQTFGEAEAKALEDGRYGLVELATAPVRLFSILVKNGIATSSTLSDNLALLANSGRVNGADAQHSFRVGVPAVALPDGAQVLASDLAGRLTGHRIPAGQVDVAIGTFAEGYVYVNVHCAHAPPDIYVGTLTSSDQPVPVLSQSVSVAINEIGNELT